MQPVIAIGLWRLYSYGVCLTARLLSGLVSILFGIVLLQSRRLLHPAVASTDRLLRQTP